MRPKTAFVTLLLLACQKHDAPTTTATADPIAPAAVSTSVTVAVSATVAQLPSASTTASASSAPPPKKVTLDQIPRSDVKDMQWGTGNVTAHRLGAGGPGAGGIGARDH